MTEPPRVSVVVPTYRRPELLSRCLSALAAQRIPATEFEVIVVDDGRSDTTRAIIDAVRTEHPGLNVALLQGRGRGPASARNIGWRAARAQIIAFMDDDAYPKTEDWLANGLKYFTDESVLAISGRVEVPIEREPPTDFQRNVQGLEQAEFLTCNALCRRSALDAIDGFDERFTAPFREDSDLQFRLEKLGKVLLRCDDILVVHPAPRGRFAISLRLQRNSMFNALLYRKHPERYRRIQSRPPVPYYAALLAAVTALAGVATRRKLPALAGLAGWSLLYFRFLAKRLRRSDRSLRHVADMALTSLLIPPLSVYWRLRGAMRYRVLFL